VLLVNSPDRHGPRRARAPGQRAHPLPAPESPSVHRSPQIPAAARMPGIKSSTCVQVALVEFPRAGRGRWARGGTPTAIGIGGINSSASVQVAPVVILAARLGIARAYVPRHRDHSHRQRDQEPEDSKAHHCLSMCRGPITFNGKRAATRAVSHIRSCRRGPFIPPSSSDTLPRFSPRPRRARPLPSACLERAGGRTRAPRPSRPGGRCRYAPRALPVTGLRCARGP
jgi:hypothetical protein